MVVGLGYTSVEWSGEVVLSADVHMDGFVTSARKPTLGGIIRNIDFSELKSSWE
jgi:hypothetical protein